MQPRLSFSRAACLMLTAVILGSCGFASAEQRQPNIVFILCDDLGWGDLGEFYQNASKRNRKHKTPALDRIALEGIQLRAHYCPAPVCAPSRASLLTGVHQGNAVIRDNQFDKALENNHTLATTLQAAGYRTAIIGKYGLQGKGDSPESWPAYPTKRGFDDFFGYVAHRDGHVHYPADQWPLGNSEIHRQPKSVYENDAEVSAGLSKCYTTDLFTARSKKWVADHVAKKSDQPFFLYLAYDTPHAALQVPSVQYPQGRGLKGGVQWLGKPGKMINTATGEIDSYRHTDYIGKGWSDVEERFATMVRRIDHSVDDFVQTLRDLGIDDNTIVVFSSDNGPHHESYLESSDYNPTSFKSYGIFDGTKRDTWEGGIRVPTFVWWPGQLKPGQISNQPSQFHDWLPTFCELAGTPIPARADGVSLAPRLNGQTGAPESEVYVEYNVGGATREYGDFKKDRRKQKRGQMQVIHMDGFKGVRVDIKSHADDFEIYDLSKDPKERNNLAAQGPTFTSLQQRMKDRVLRIRTVNESAKRPYDQTPVPGVDQQTTDSGLRVAFYGGKFAYVPSLDLRKPLSTRLAKSPSDLGSIPADTTAIELTGLITVPANGLYQFGLTSRDGSFMRIHDAAVVDGDFGVAPGTETVGTIRLEKGQHPIRITCLVNDNTNPELRVRWGISGSDLKDIDAASWSSN